MEKITFTCETITPMFLAGADGMTPELRAPSIKGALRFWWRAMNGHLGLAELKEREAEIFGGTSPARRSSVVIRVDKPLSETFKTEMLPHRERAWKAEAFTPKQEFIVSFSMPTKIMDKKNEIEIFNIKKLEALFLLVSALGGLGKRVRRGFGSFSVKEISIGENKHKLQVKNIQDIFNQVKILSPSFFTLNDRKIIFTYSGKTTPYPFIKEIEVGKKKKNILKLVGYTTHNFKANDRNAYEASIGHANRGRFASPVFISLLDEETPVVTSLNTVPDKNRHHVSRIIQEDFKSKILK